MTVNEMIRWLKDVQDECGNWEIELDIHPYKIDHLEGTEGVLGDKILIVPIYD